MEPIPFAALILAAAYVLVAVGRGISGLAFAFIERQAESEYRKGQAEHKALLVQLFSTFAPMLLQAIDRDMQRAARRSRSPLEDLVVMMNGMPPSGPTDPTPPPGGAGGPVPEKMPTTA